jgi:hypothetical protein
LNDHGKEPPKKFRIFLYYTYNCRESQNNDLHISLEILMLLVLSLVFAIFMRYNKIAKK